MTMHPEFEKRKEQMWTDFFNKDYDAAARAAANILQDTGGLDAVHVAGLSLIGLNQFEEGYSWTAASCSLAKAMADWYANAAIACMDKHQYVHAMVFLENGVKEFPENVRLHYMQGLCFCHTQVWDKAIQCLDETLALDPAFYHAHMSKGFALHMSGRYEEALAEYDAILDVPESSREEVVNNYACVLLEQGKRAEALELLDRNYPDSKRPGTIYNRSFLHLGMGRWPQAWHEYRLRVDVQERGDLGVPTVAQPVAKTLDDLRGKHLFLLHEQGLGDSLMFLRYAQLLRPLVSDLTIGLPKPLHRLAERLKLDQPFTVVSDGALDEERYAPCEVSLPMLDCPAVFDTTVATIPYSGPYFSVPDAEVRKHRLPSTDKPRIGLVWSGASRPENIRAHAIDKRRSIGFESMKPLLYLYYDLFDFVSLQLPDQHVTDRRLLQPITNEFDVLDTAAVVRQLDLVITIDSAMMHLAGALGKPVWMLSRYDGCWRWFWDGRTDSPWYPNLKIYHQTAHNTWPEVIDRVIADLALTYSANALKQRSQRHIARTVYS